jgi:hypothetical protein
MISVVLATLVCVATGSSYPAKVTRVDGEIAQVQLKIAPHTSMTVIQPIPADLCELVDAAAESSK